MIESKSSRYLYGATKDTSTYANDFNRQYNIKLPPAPKTTNNNITLIFHIAGDHVYKAGINAKRAVNKLE